MGYTKIALMSIILLTGAVSSTVTDVKSINADRPVTRFLSPDKLESNEERGINFEAFPAFAKFNSKIVDQTKLRLWLFRNKPAIKVFENMELTSVKGNLLANPKFQVWMKYVNDLNKKEPNQAKSAASVLTDYYDDAVLSKMLNAAMKDQSTKDLVLTLQAQRLENWKRLDIAPFRVLQLLNLERRDILANPMLTSWMKYMDDFNVRNPTVKTTMIDIFSLYLRDDRLAQVLEAGQKVPATKEISITLQTEWFAKWERMKFTPNDAFRAVGLKDISEATGSILSDPVLNFWVRYMNEFNRKYPSEKTSMIDTFRKNYADEAIVDMIVAAKADPTTKLTATNLELSLLTKWVLEKKSPDTVARWLNADKSGTIGEMYRAKYNSMLSNGAE